MEIIVIIIIKIGIKKRESITSIVKASKTQRIKTIPLTLLILILNFQNSHQDNEQLSSKTMILMMMSFKMTVSIIITNLLSGKKCSIY